VSQAWEPGDYGVTVESGGSPWRWSGYADNPYDALACASLAWTQERHGPALSDDDSEARAEASERIAQFTDPPAWSW
jgi:hypothetical protein